jgi:hypothetical protein
MKNAFILLVIILTAAGWVATKFYQKTNKSRDEKARFIELAENYNNNAALFIVDHVEKYHDEAFKASYSMWVLSPLSELDLSSHYDEKAYYLEMGKKIGQLAKESGRGDAYKILVEMGPEYGVERNRQASTKPAPQSTSGTAERQPKAEKESALKTGGLGDKRRLPSSRRRDDRYDR